MLIQAVRIFEERPNSCANTRHRVFAPRSRSTGQERLLAIMYERARMCVCVEHQEIRGHAGRQEGEESTELLYNAELTSLHSQLS